MTGRVLLVRHGQTPWNDAGRLQGTAPVGLSRTGREQARACGRRLADGGAIDAVVTSPLRRAVETADLIGRLVGCDAPRRKPAWRERSFGEYEGRDASAVFAAVPEIHPRKAAFDPDAEPPGGESVTAVRERVLRGWHSLRERVPAESTVVLVTHTTPIRLLLGELDGLSVREAVRSFSHRPGAVREIAVSEDGVSVSQLVTAQSAPSQ